MRLKKCNAVLALLATVALVVHIGYSAFAYVTFSYNQAVKTLTAVPVLALTCLHAVTGMCSVFLLGDGTRIDPYQKQNGRTVAQRVSAALIFPLLIVHLKTFDLLKGAAEGGAWLAFGLVLGAQIAFYAAVAAHIVTSFSRALVTLGLLSSRETQAKIDRVVAIVCVCLVLFTAFVVVKGQIGLFLPTQGAS